HFGIMSAYVNAYTTDVVHKTLRGAGWSILPLDIDPFTLFPRFDPDTNFHGTVFLHTGLFGFPSFDEAMLQQVRKRGGLFIEDSCNSFGCRIGCHDAGSLGDASFFSFRVGKALSTGGGAIRINDARLEESLLTQYSSIPAFSRLEAKWRRCRL